MSITRVLFIHKLVHDLCAYKGIAKPHNEPTAGPLDISTFGHVGSLVQ